MIAGYATWKALFYQSSNIIIISKDEETASEVLDYCRFIHSKLPGYLAPELDRNRMSLLAFPTLGSKIRALSAKSSSGVGFGSASLIILDENDFHPFAEENFIEIKPMIDAGGSRQLVILSAPNRQKLTSNFKRLWRDARKGLNNFHPIMTPFGVVPYHTEEWLAQMKKEYPPKELETRYFKTEEEALSVTVAGKFFDMEALKDLSSRVCLPLTDFQGIDLRGGIIKIYKPSVPTNKYVGYVDPSMGKEDPFHMVFLEVGTKEEVCNAHGWLPADEVAVIFDNLVRYFNNARNSYEYNTLAGGVFKSAIAVLMTPNQEITRMPDGKLKQGQHGYYISNPLKKQLLGNLRQSVFRREVVIHDAETIDEFSMLIWEEGEDIPEVPDKEHDDRIMCWMGAVDLLNRLPKSSPKLQTFEGRGDGKWKPAR